MQCVCNTRKRTRRKRRSIARSEDIAARNTDLQRCIWNWQKNMVMYRKKSDSRTLAKCGKVTKADCYKKRANLPECKGCKLIRKWFSSYSIVDGREYKVCSVCGRVLPTAMFYQNRKKVGDEYRHYLSGECRLCKSEYLRNVRRKNKKQAI